MVVQTHGALDLNLGNYINVFQFDSNVLGLVTSPAE